MNVNNNTIGVNALERIGKTPLLRLEKICPQGNLFAKAEWYNPQRPIKDRAAYYMVQGLLVGISGGGALVCSLKVAQQHQAGRVVTIIHDNGDKYLEERFLEE